MSTEDVLVHERSDYRIPSDVSPVEECVEVGQQGVPNIEGGSSRSNHLFTKRSWVLGLQVQQLPLFNSRIFTIYISIIVCMGFVYWGT